MEVKSTTKNFYEVTSKVTKTCEDGMEKVVKNTIAVSAVSFSDAENTAILYEGKPLNKVCAIKEAPYREYVEKVSYDVTDYTYYKVTVGLITIDEKTEKEKVNKVAYLVNADTTKEAQDIINTMFNNTMIDYKIIAVQESTVTDVVLD